MADWILGQTSARYETGNRGPGTVSTGIGDHGGVSYGSYQLSTNEGTVREFLRFNPDMANTFAGLSPGTPAFSAQWRATDATDPIGFQAAQHDFIQTKFYDVQMGRLQANGIDLSQRGPAVQDMLWSTSVQFRNLTTGIVTGALNGRDPASLSDSDIVSAVQDYKRDHNNTLFRSSPTLWPGLLSRAANEKESLLELSRSFGGDQVPSRSPALNSEQQKALNQFKQQAGTQLENQGYSSQQIEAMGRSTLRFLTLPSGAVGPGSFLLSKDGTSIGVVNDGRLLGEVATAHALREDPAILLPRNRSGQLDTLRQVSPPPNEPALNR